MTFYFEDFYFLCNNALNNAIALKNAVIIVHEILIFVEIYNLIKGFLYILLFYLFWSKYHGAAMVRSLCAHTSR